jgi:hypothetical protein
MIDLAMEPHIEAKDLRVKVEHQLGLDQPFHIHYLRWMGLVKQEDGQYHGVLQGDLGDSLWY